MYAQRVVLPAAGLGTRFLPITKSIPKEMLPILEKPAVHYSVYEAYRSGFNEVCFITNKHKHAIADYFDYAPTLDGRLHHKDRQELLYELHQLIEAMHFTYIPQHEPLGLGHAILCAQQAIHESYFGIALPDDIIFSRVPVLQQLRVVAERYNCSVLAIEEVPLASTSSYGIVNIGNRLEDNVFIIDDLIEKPMSNPPSNLAIVGRYVLSTEIFRYLKNMKRDHTHEVQLTQALRDFIQDGNKMVALRFEGVRYDLGTPYGWLQANQYCQQHLL